MADLRTSYLGLQLATPVIVSSSGLTNSVDKIKKLADSGAGAVVLKSIFEEQIVFEAGQLEQPGDYPEAADYLQNYVKSQSVDQYLKLIQNAKKEVDIPVIASVNCISAKDWVDFSTEFEKAGADALELNIFFLPDSKTESGNKFEEIYYHIIAGIKEKTQIPLSIKLGPYFSSLPNVVHQISNRGAKGVVLFNRFYEPDIDIDKMQMTTSEVLSNPADIRQSLRWVGIISALCKEIDIAASTGIHSWQAAVKQLLAGANTIQVCSTLYKNGPDYLKTIIEGINLWMDKKGFESIDQFRGKMNYEKIDNPAIYERSQFMRYFSSIN